MIDVPPFPPPPPMRRQLEAALAHLQHLAHGHALQPGLSRHHTTPEAEISSCTIRISAEEASILWAAGNIALLMGAADG